MFFSNLQETSLTSARSPGEGSLDRRAVRRQARRVDSLAAGLQRIVADTDRSSPWSAPSMSTLIHRSVGIACAGSLTELAARLRAGDVDASAIDQIDRFLTDGARSPLYGTDVAAARFEALRLLDLSAN